MKVLVQWTKANPEDWLEFDLRDTPQTRRLWERLAKKAEPTGGETIDDNEGWIFDVNIQGVHFAGADHYAVELVSDPEFGLRVYVWNDDPEDWPVGTRIASIWTFFEPAPDPRYGGQINTRQVCEFFADDIGIRPDARPYSEFTVPAEAITRHGIWVPDELRDQHRAVASQRGWREWVA